MCSSHFLSDPTEMATCERGTHSIYIVSDYGEMHLKAIHHTHVLKSMDSFIESIAIGESNKRRRQEDEVKT